MNRRISKNPAFFPHRSGIGLVVIAAMVVLGLVVGAGPEKKKADEKPTFEMREWSFEWIVARAEDSRLVVEKTQERIGIALSTRSERIQLKPQDAKAVGTALAETDLICDRIRGTQTEETRPAGTLEVKFSWSEDVGFWIVIREKEGLFAESVYLGREEARTLGPHLLRGPEMVAYVDATIRP